MNHTESLLLLHVFAMGFFFLLSRRYFILLSYYNVFTADGAFYPSRAGVHFSPRGVEPGAKVEEEVGFCWTTPWQENEQVEQEEEPIDQYLSIN